MIAELPHVGIRNPLFVFSIRDARAAFALNLNGTPARICIVLLALLNAFCPT